MSCGAGTLEQALLSAGPAGKFGFQDCDVLGFLVAQFAGKLPFHGIFGGGLGPLAEDFNSALS